jgi:hypothetical protein
MSFMFLFALKIIAPVGLHRFNQPLYGKSQLNLAQSKKNTDYLQYSPEHQRLQ